MARPPASIARSRFGRGGTRGGTSRSSQASAAWVRGRTVRHGAPPPVRSRRGSDAGRNQASAGSKHAHDLEDRSVDVRYVFQHAGRHHERRTWRRRTGARPRRRPRTHSAGCRPRSIAAPRSPLPAKIESNDGAALLRERHRERARSAAEVEDTIASSGQEIEADLATQCERAFVPTRRARVVAIVVARRGLVEVSPSIRARHRRIRAIPYITVPQWRRGRPRTSAASHCECPNLRRAPCGRARHARGVRSA